MPENEESPQPRLRGPRACSRPKTKRLKSLRNRSSRISVEKQTAEAESRFGRFFESISWQRPTFPHSYPCSIIGPAGLNFRVRDGNGCDPRGMATRKPVKPKLEKRDSKIGTSSGTSGRFPFSIFDFRNQQPNEASTNPSAALPAQWNCVTGKFYG